MVEIMKHLGYYPAIPHNQGVSNRQDQEVLHTLYSGTDRRHFAVIIARDECGKEQID